MAAFGLIASVLPGAAVRPAAELDRGAVEFALTAMVGTAAAEAIWRTDPAVRLATDCAQRRNIPGRFLTAR